MMLRSPWFNTKKQSPVREGWYETSCDRIEGMFMRLYMGGSWFWEESGVLKKTCVPMRWRGLAYPHPQASSSTAQDCGQQK